MTEELAVRFDFDALPRPAGYRRTYAGVLEIHRRGLLSEGFLWELARHDEVFAAYLRKHGIEKP